MQHRSGTESAVGEQSRPLARDHRVLHRGGRQGRVNPTAMQHKTELGRWFRGPLGRVQGGAAPA